MRVRLTRKYSDQIDGVDLQGCEVGDVLDLSLFEARILLAEGWAVPDPQAATRRLQPPQTEDLPRAS